MKKDLLVAVDVSGSTLSQERSDQFQKIIDKKRDLIDIVYFDTEIRKEKGKILVGRGGTDYQPVINYADKHYKSVFIVTDGLGPKPTEPKSAQVVWVLTNDGSAPVKWGMHTTLGIVRQRSSMGRHVCTYCPKVKVCDWSCLDKCKEEYNAKNSKGKSRTSEGTDRLRRHAD